MKDIKFQKWFLATIMPAVFSLISCSKDEEGQPGSEKKGKVTFIYYSQVDEGISGEGLKQLSEITRSSKSDYRCLAMSNFPEKTREQFAKKMGLDVVGTLIFGMVDGDSTLLSNSGKILIDMSKPETLTAMLNKAAELYPAEEYVIMFNGHGNGWNLVDDGTRSAPSGEADMPALTVTGLSQGIRSSVLNGKIKMIFFDACLMMSYEYAGDLASCTQYMLGTSTASWGTDGKMTKLMTLIQSKNNWDDISKSMVDYMEDIYEGLGTVSVAAKMDGIPDLLVKMKRLNEQLNTLGTNDDDILAEIVEAKTATFCFDTGASTVTDVRDANDFYYRTKDLDPSLNKLYADFFAAFNKVVIASKGSSPVTGLADGNPRFGLSMLLFDESVYYEDIHNTLYRNLVFTRETNPIKLFSLFN